MQVVARFRAADGSEWPTPEAAAERDAAVACVCDAMAPLGPLRSLGRDEYRQHRPTDVIVAKVRLLRSAAARDTMLAKWLAKAKAQGVEEEAIHPFSWVGRYFDDTGGPFAAAWARIGRIDSQGREWQQPYFVDHPPAGARAV